MAFQKTISAGLVKALTDEDGNEEYPRGLRALNTTLFTFSLEQLKKVLKVQKNVMVLNVTVEAEPGEENKKALLKVLEGCANLEQVEIVANPSLQFFMEVRPSERCFLPTCAFSTASVACHVSSFITAPHKANISHRYRIPVPASSRRASLRLKTCRHYRRSVASSPRSKSASCGRLPSAQSNGKERETGGLVVRKKDQAQPLQRSKPEIEQLMLVTLPVCRCLQRFRVQSESIDASPAFALSFGFPGASLQAFLVPYPIRWA